MRVKQGTKAQVRTDHPHHANRAGVKAKIAEVRAYIGEPQRTAALAKVAADEARAIERAARQDAHDIRK